MLFKAVVKYLPSSKFLKISCKGERSIIFVKNIPGMIHAALVQDFIDYQLSCPILIVKPSKHF